MATKVRSSKAPAFAQGGKGHMFGKQSAGPKSPDHVGKAQSGSGGKWAVGGSGHMFGKQSASPAKPGSSCNK